MSLCGTLLQGMRQLNMTSRAYQNALRNVEQYEKDITDWCQNHYNKIKHRRISSNYYSWNIEKSPILPIKNKITIKEAINKFNISKKWIKRLKYKIKKIKYHHRNNNLIKINNDWYICTELVKKYITPYSLDSTYST